MKRIIFIIALFIFGLLLSAQTTAPIIAATGWNACCGNLDFTNSNKLSGYVDGKTDIVASTTAMNTLSAYANVPYFLLY